MKVRMLCGMGGEPTYKPGDVADLEQGHAERLIANGSAEAVDVVPPRKPRKPKQRP